MERKEAIRGAYRLTGGNNFYDGMITCSTLSGKAVCRLVWDMNKVENDAYLEKALSGIPEHFSGKLLEVPVGTGILTMPLYKTLPKADITCLDYSADMMGQAQEKADRLHLKNHPCAAVVNLGCGLDNTGRACNNGRCKIYNLDFPDVIALRQQLLPAGEREQNIPCDLKDPAWFAKIDASGGAVFFASGVFYYFLTQQVKALVQGMADAFPGGVLVFDAANRTAVKMIAKTWLRTAKIKDVGAYFAVSDAERELSPWDSRLQVSSRGYMLGYNDLKDPSVSGFFRFLARVGDNGMKMQIVKIGFGDRQ